MAAAAALDYTIVIASYNRVEILGSSTLAVLERYGIPKEKIVLIVANEAQKEAYKVHESRVAEIRVGVLGYHNVHNFILDSFPLGAHLVCMDDDVTQFVHKGADDKLATLPCLHTVIQSGFAECEKQGAILFGVAPVPNGFFMKHGISTNLKFIVGTFWGIINPTSAIIKLHFSEKADYHRTLQAFKHSHSVIRFNDVSLKSAYYKLPGGIGSEGRVEREKAAVAYLLENYPRNVRLNEKRKSIYPEIILFGK